MDVVRKRGRQPLTEAERARRQAERAAGGPRRCVCGAALGKSEQRCLDCRTFVCANCTAVFVVRVWAATPPIFCSRPCLNAAIRVQRSTCPGCAQEFMPKLSGKGVRATHCSMACKVAVLARARQARKEAAAAARSAAAALRADARAAADAAALASRAATCAHCQQPFTKTHGGRRYCSPDCAYRANRAQIDGYRKADPAKVAERKREWRKANRDKVKAEKARYRERVRLRQLAQKDAQG